MLLESLVLGCRLLKVVLLVHIQVCQVGLRIKEPQNGISPLRWLLEGHQMACFRNFFELSPYCFGEQFDSSNSRDLIIARANYLSWDREACGAAGDAERMRVSHGVTEIHQIRELFGVICLADQVNEGWKAIGEARDEGLRVSIQNEAPRHGPHLPHVEAVFPRFQNEAAERCAVQRDSGDGQLSHVLRMRARDGQCHPAAKTEATEVHPANTERAQNGRNVLDVLLHGTVLAQELGLALIA